jgi:hypothetical protein
LLGEEGIASVVESGSDLLGESDPLVELADRQESGVAGEGSGRDFDFDGSGGEEIEGKERNRV